MPDGQSKLSPAVSIIVAGVVIAAAIVYANMHPSATSGPSAPVANQPTTQTQINVRAPNAKDHYLGSPNAPVVLIEYSDFQCPYCSLVYPTLKKIVDGSNGQIAWVYREYPLVSIHPQAGPAANAAECIAEQLGNAGFWKYADAIFADQSKLTPVYSAQLAQQFGANMQKYNVCVAAQTYQSKIDTDTTEAQANGGNGTPYTVVWSAKGEKAVSGAQLEAQFTSVIKSLQ